MAHSDNEILQHAFQSFCAHLPLKSRQTDPSHVIHEIHINVQQSTELRHGNNESYSLQVRAPDTTIQAPEIWGARHALETLLQLADDTSPNNIFLAADITHDEPSFAWRGLMLDTARHYLSTTILVRTIRAMAASKYNVFHWHLTDAQSFPILLDGAPELGLLGSFQKGTKTYDSMDVRKIINVGRMHGIRVVPEIDLPSHTASWSGAHPDIVVRCRTRAARDADVHKAQDKDTLDLSKEETFIVVKRVLISLSSMFPAQHLHLGGDEVDLQCLSDNKGVMERARAAHGRSVTAAQLLQFFWTRVIGMVLEMGKTPIVWQGTFDGRVVMDKRVLVQGWKCWGSPMTLGERSVEKALGQGKSTLQSSCWYLDWDSRFKDYYEQKRMLGFKGWDSRGGSGDSRRRDTNRKNRRKSGWDTTSSDESGLLGGEMCAWSETMDESNLECRLWPRALSMAERLWSWSSSASSSYDDQVERRMRRQHQRMIERGLLLDSSLPGANKEYCGQVEQSIQRDVHRLSTALLVPHLYLGKHQHQLDSMLWWSRKKFSQNAVGYVVVFRSMTQASEIKRSKQLQMMAMNVGMPHLDKCILPSGNLVLLLGLFGKPVVDCNQFQQFQRRSSRRESGDERAHKYFVDIDFVTRTRAVDGWSGSEKSSMGSERGERVMRSLRVRLDAANGMRASWRLEGDQRGKSGV